MLSTFQDDCWMNNEDLIKDDLIYDMQCKKYLEPSAAELFGYSEPRVDGAPQVSLHPPSKVLQNHMKIIRSCSKCKKLALLSYIFGKMIPHRFLKFMFCLKTNVYS